MKSNRWSIILIAILLAFCSCHREKKVKHTMLLMGTAVEITALGEDGKRLEEAVHAAFSEIKRIETKFSTHQSDSVISRINRAAGIEPVDVDEETLDLITGSIRISNLSEEAFDITFAPLAEIWNYKDPPSRLPTDEELKPLLDKVGYKKIKVDPDKKTVFLEKRGMRIDLGGIAKGYAVDRAIRVLQDAGVKNALVNAGGDLRAIGSYGRRAWGVGIQDPGNRERLLGKMKIRDRAVATSGDYERFFTVEGKRYSHIIDPRTGLPVTGCQSVTVTAETAMLADALATAAFVLGPEKGLALIESLQGLEGIIIDIDGKQKISSGLIGAVEWFGEEAAKPSSP